MISHDGYTFFCSSPRCDVKYDTCAVTERTAIKYAREAGWAVVHVRITKGIARSQRRTVRREFCPGCKHVVGA